MKRAEIRYRTASGMARTISVKSDGSIAWSDKRHRSEGGDVLTLANLIAALIPLASGAGKTVEINPAVVSEATAISEAVVHLTPDKDSEAGLLEMVQGVFVLVPEKQKAGVFRPIICAATADLIGHLVVRLDTYCAQQGVRHEVRLVRNLRFGLGGAK